MAEALCVACLCTNLTRTMEPLFTVMRALFNACRYGFVHAKATTTQTQTKDKRCCSLKFNRKRTSKQFSDTQIFAFISLFSVSNPITNQLRTQWPTADRYPRRQSKMAKMLWVFSINFDSIFSLLKNKYFLEFLNVKSQFKSISLLGWQKVETACYKW